MKLHSLEGRRKGGYLIEVFKWVKGFDKGDAEKVLTKDYILYKILDSYGQLPLAIGKNK